MTSLARIAALIAFPNAATHAASKPIAVSSVFTALLPDGNRHYYPKAVKVQAVRMCTEGLSIAAPIASVAHTGAPDT